MSCFPLSRSPFAHTVHYLRALCTHTLVPLFLTLTFKPRVLSRSCDPLRRRLGLLSFHPRSNRSYYFSLFFPLTFFLPFFRCPLPFHFTPAEIVLAAALSRGPPSPHVPDILLLITAFLSCFPSPRPFRCQKRATLARARPFLLLFSFNVFPPRCRPCFRDTDPTSLRK